MLQAALFLVLRAALLQASAAPPLELRVGGQWVSWRGYVPLATATRDSLLARAVSWRDSQPGLRVGDFEVRTAEGLLRNSVAVVELDPARFRFALASAPDWARRSADEWLRRDSTLVLAVNTGLFRENGTPQGLVLVEGERRSGLAGWLDAVVVLDEAGPRTTDVAGARGLGGVSAFQTLPWLVRGGRVVFGVSSGARLSRAHRDRRITLCLGDDGLVRLLLSNFEVFGATAGRIPVGLTLPEQAAVAAGAGCRDAVALDGGISAQVAVRGATGLIRMPGWRKVPLMMVVRRR